MRLLPIPLLLRRNGQSVAIWRPYYASVMPYRWRHLAERRLATMSRSTRSILRSTRQPGKKQDDDREIGYRFNSEDEESNLVSVLEAAEQESRLVLLGEAGSGKSSFVRQLVAAQAKKRLDTLSEDGAESYRAHTYAYLCPRSA